MLGWPLHTGKYILRIEISHVHNRKVRMEEHWQASATQRDAA
jgi:hypothetical protein